MDFLSTANMKVSRENISIVLFFVFHLIGGLGLSSNYQSLFLYLTPAHLIFSFLILLWANNDFSLSFFKTVAILYFIGFLIEVLGVQTGLLFGEYYYGKVLGYQLFDTPLIIGVNWVILCLSANAVISHFCLKPFPKIILSSLILVLLDVLIEPVAITLDFWHWVAIDIPIQNYFMWFLVALLMNWIVHLNKLTINYKVGFGLFLSQILFFTILSF